MDEELRIRGDSPNTGECYVRGVHHFGRHFMVPPDQPTLEHIRQYPLHLARERQVSWASFNQIVCALRFFYREVLKQDWDVRHLPYQKTGPPAARDPEPRGGGRPVHGHPHPHATDVNDDTLVLARAKSYPAPDEFTRDDAYAPAAGPERFDSGFAALWLSHVDLSRLAEFLRAFHSHLEPGAVVFMFDERLTDAREHRAPASRTDGAGNRYEMRRLESRERFEIVKNAFDRPRLDRLVGRYATSLTYQELRCFWTLEYAVA